MTLETYAKKRNFTKTPEPHPKLGKQKVEELIFVIQEHHASHLHWDLRFEHKGVLKSWAVPKEPPVELGIKRLAIETEDHPLEYANFEGTIAEGLYGSGTVKIWDKGTYIAEEYSDKEIIADLNGEKMKGKYVLIKAPFKGVKNSWLFFKKKKE